MNKDLTLTATMAATLMSLSLWSSPSNDWEDVVADNDTAVCVDQYGKRIDDDGCPGDSGAGGGGGHYSGGGRWYYMRRNSIVPLYGDSIRDAQFADGSFSPRPGTQYYLAPNSTHLTRSQAVSRGGLGSGGRRFGGGWS